MEFVFMWVVFAVLVGFLADSRGRSGIGFFFVAMLLSPLLALAILLVTKNLKIEQEAVAQRTQEHERQLEALRAITAGQGQRAAPLSVAEELGKLAALRERGVITADEYERQKARLLATGS